MSALLVRALSASLGAGRSYHSRVTCDDPRILVIRRNRMGDMICTLPLLRALRRHFPSVHLAVACDAPGAPIARACSAVDEVILLQPGWNRWAASIGQARGLQDFDWVIAAKAGFDGRLAFLARLTNAARRIGYENEAASDFYTDTVPIPADLWRIHQIEATLGLLAPLGVEMPADPVFDLKIDLPDTAVMFAETLAPFWQGRRMVLMNVSSTSPLRFREEDFAALVSDFSSRNDLAVGLVGLPADLGRAQQLADRTNGRARVLATPGPLELAALLAHAHVLVTGEGGAGHLAAAMGTAAVVLWSEGPFEKWYSRGPRHVFVRLEPGETLLPPGRVHAALAPYLESGPDAFVP